MNSLSLYLGVGEKNIISKNTVIIGAGAAGIMTGISAGIHGAKDVTILNASPRIGLKILMAGGGRCNITNAQLDYKKFYGASPNAIKKIILQFPPSKMIEFLEKEGLHTKIEEPWFKYFPVTDKAQSVVDTLLQKLKKLNIPIEFPVIVKDFEKCDEKWVVHTTKQDYICDNLVVACGGFSYPHTGSDGKLWNKISKLGLQMAEHYPALTPLKTSDKHFHKLKGIAVPCILQAIKNNKVIQSENNPVLFTHNGLSGPSILNISQWFTSTQDVILKINFLPSIELKIWEKELLKQPHNMKIENFLARFFPRRFAETIVAITFGNSQIIKGDLSKIMRKKLIDAVYNYYPNISGNHGYKKAEVTAGGIILSELNTKTMSCRNLENLYAVGEIVNIHGDIGGYNFQWAWSSGWVCGKALGNSKKNAIL